MKQVQKKSADAAANQMIAAAYHRQIGLAWDRSEGMQPKCGFGRMGICCTDCMEGPCRINPFDTVERLGTCGRSAADFTKQQLLAKAADGAAALASLALEFGGELSCKAIKTLLTTSDAMHLPAEVNARMESIGQAAAETLLAIGKAKEEVLGQRQAAATDANLGALRLSSANIVLHGHIAPKVIKLLAEAAAQSEAPVSLTAMCGSEISGSLNIPVLTNYESQELPLLTGTVDMLVVGSQCVMPAALSLAGTQKILVASAGDIESSAQAVAVVAAAVKAYQRRGAVQLPEYSEVVYSGSHPEAAAALLHSVSKGFSQGHVQGVAYLSGCGNIVNTQDAEIIKLAKKLLAENYVLFAAGCAGAALAKTGMCRPDYPVSQQLKQSLPEGVPAAIYLGSCQEAGRFLTAAKAFEEAGVPVLAVLPEITHNKVFATAVALATAGIPAYIGLDEAFVLPELGLKLLPLADLDATPAAWIEAAAAK